MFGGPVPTGRGGAHVTAADPCTAPGGAWGGQQRGGPAGVIEGIPDIAQLSASLRPPQVRSVAWAWRSIRSVVSQPTHLSVTDTP